MKLPLDVNSVKGFLDADEGTALYENCIECTRTHPALEVGSYCGKSTVYLGTACKENDKTLFAVDHHRGSEEHQPGEEYHDTTLFDEQAGLMDSFREFRATMRTARLEEHVVPLVASSVAAARNWSTPLGFVFIDGGHSMQAALNDYRAWAGHVVSGGVLAIHDIFPDPDDGGQAPFTIFKMAQDSGLFEVMPMVKTLGMLRRL